MHVQLPKDGCSCLKFVNKRLECYSPFYSNTTTVQQCKALCKQCTVLKKIVMIFWFSQILMEKVEVKEGEELKISCLARQTF